VTAAEMSCSERSAAVRRVRVMVDRLSVDN
jgi:hypothetical protein